VDGAVQEAADVSRQASAEEADSSKRLKLLERRLQLRRLYRKVLLAQVLLEAERCASRRTRGPPREVDSSRTLRHTQE
jgi:hypothetical protein